MSGCRCNDIIRAESDLRNIASGMDRLSNARDEADNAGEQLSQVANLVQSGVYARNINATTTAIAQLHVPLVQAIGSVRAEATAARSNISSRLAVSRPADRAWHASQG